MPLKDSIQKLMHKQNLDPIACQAALNEMLTADANSLQTAAFLVLLRSKTETIEELVTLVNTLKEKMIVVPTTHKVLDIVGTGGDGANTINISTASAIIAASCGIKIAKHGNRAVSSLAGSADVLTALGVNIDVPPAKISESIDKIGIGFCFSPNFHPAMQKLRQLRKTLNVPTTFNLLGPLLNPTNPTHFLIGVYHESLLSPIAETLRQLSTSRSIVVHGAGLDEISCVGPAKIIEITANELKENVIDPLQFGLSRCNVTDLRGGDAETNAQIIKKVFSGKSVYPAIANTFILNAAVALYLYGRYSSIAEALPHVTENLYDGKALSLLKNWIEFSHE